MDLERLEFEVAGQISMKYHGKHGEDLKDESYQ